MSSWAGFGPRAVVWRTLVQAMSAQLGYKF